MSVFIRRCVGVILVLLGVMALIFVVLRIIPGNPAAVLLNEHVNKETIERLTASMNLDKPVPEQFLLYLQGALRGDLGQSYYMKQPVLSLVLQAFPYTVKLTVFAAAFAWLFGIGVGVISAVHHDRLPDYLFRGVSLLGVSVPVFMVALFLQYLFYFKFSLLPLVYDGTLVSMMLPAIALGWNSAGSVARLTRSSLMEQFNESYLDTARAKGLTSRQAIFRHGLKNAMVPVITMLALQLSGMLSGAVITESVFGIAGLGKLALSAVETRDMPLLQGTVLFSALIISLGNIISDIVNVCMDPRLRV
ncbi:ABC transporter permease [Butyrivibrio sp. AE3006]|uniref:ABC transporter permease n=1 Tax=Butyrivibrio sp. AE3006 TaxID=1280673 RepID=UPI00047CCD63|nr:ABC transporter permease [Butyrivibrio sp. AE3006]